jgi:hypothetical protein
VTSGSAPDVRAAGACLGLRRGVFRPGGHLKVEGERFRQGVRSTPEGVALTGS